MTTSPSVSIIIPNWNGKELLGVCLQSLKKLNYNDFEIIVVDNGSNDGSVEFLLKEHKDVIIKRFKKNKGFSAAVNEGIKIARGQYIALLNNDTEVDSAWLDELVGALDRHPGAGICASKMYNYYQRNIIDNAGDFMSIYPYPCGYGEMDSPNFSNEKYVLSACAGAAIYRREVFDRVGLFDEDFFAYYEDVDLSYRAQWAGFKVLYVPTAVVYHIHKASSDRIKSRRFYLEARNLIVLHIKNTPSSLLLRVLTILSIETLLRTSYYSLTTGNLTMIFKVWVGIIKQVPSSIKKRRLIEKDKKVTDEYICSILDPIKPWTSYYEALFKRILSAVCKKILKSKDSNQPKN